MNASTRKILAACLGLFVAVGHLAGAVTFTVTPSTVSNTYTGIITLQITGLNTGETVTVQKFLDLNTNSLIDGNDWLVQQFKLTDGQAAVIGGVTNINVPGDTDSTAGQITAQLNFQSSDFVQDFVGKYLYRLYRTNNPVATNLFTVTNTGFAQSISGNVTNSGTNVANAAIVLFITDTNGGLNPGFGCVANNAGAYTIKAPPGDYQLVAFKSNYLANTAASPAVQLNSGAIINTNLPLLNANQTISGKFVDATNTSVGLPGLIFHAQSSNGLLALGSTDTNGNFSIRVTANQWQISASDGAFDFLGYVNLQNSTAANTTGGSISGVTITTPKANALFYGYVLDSQNHPMANVLMSSADASQYQDGPKTGPNGYYVAGALAGTWGINIDINNPSLTNYDIPTGLQTNLNNGQAVLQNFTVVSCSQTAILTTNLPADLVNVYYDQFLAAAGHGKTSRAAPTATSGCAFPHLEQKFPEGAKHRIQKIIGMTGLGHRLGRTENEVKPADMLEAVGVIGVNLIHAAFYHPNSSHPQHIFRLRDQQSFFPDQSATDNGVIHRPPVETNHERKIWCSRY